MALKHESEGITSALTRLAVSF